jgi:23S rRNA pseudouridine2605 synthase
VCGDITNLDIDALQEGITIDGVTYREVNVEPEKDFAQKGQNSWLQVTLTEGKNREIRRIMDYFDLSVNRLIRTSYGPYELGDLQPGEWREEVVIRD